MKTLITFLSLIFLSSFNSGDIPQSTSLNDDNVSAGDILEYLEETEDALKETVKGLSDDQMSYSPDAESWSVAQIMEHIIIVEGALKGMLEAKLQEEATPDRKDEVQMTDDEILAFITNRGQKIQTQDQFQPSGKFTASDEAWEAFDDQREDIVDWLKDSDADLRNYINEFPFGKIDAYQTVLFMAGHTERHTKQIEEIKNNPDFPES
jgi:hypothetical protein